ncbi:MAG TPA: hypothetical protein VIY47_09510 [Ignavibacteriaceae bacterium]
MNGINEMGDLIPFSQKSNSGRWYNDLTLYEILEQNDGVDWTENLDLSNNRYNLSGWEFSPSEAKINCITAAQKFLNELGYNVRVIDVRENEEEDNYDWLISGNLSKNNSVNEDKCNMNDMRHLLNLVEGSGTSRSIVLAGYLEKIANTNKLKNVLDPVDLTTVNTIIHRISSALRNGGFSAARQFCAQNNIESIIDNYVEEELTSILNHEYKVKETFDELFFTDYNKTTQPNVRELQFADALDTISDDKELIDGLKYPNPNDAKDAKDTIDFLKTVSQFIRTQGMYQARKYAKHRKLSIQWDEFVDHKLRRAGFRNGWWQNIQNMDDTVMEKSTSEKQARFMAACAHGADYDSCPPKKVSREFNQADKGTKQLSNAMKHRADESSHGSISPEDVDAAYQLRHEAFLADLPNKYELGKAAEALAIKYERQEQRKFYAKDDPVVPESHVSDGQMSNPGVARDILAMEGSNYEYDLNFIAQSIRSNYDMARNEEDLKRMVAADTGYGGNPEFNNMFHSALDHFLNGEDSSWAHIGDQDPIIEDNMKETMYDPGFEEDSDELEEDIQNGYKDKHYASGNDYFPNGADGPVVDKVGPSGARHGDNPEQKKMQIAEVHKELVYGYRAFLGESAQKKS